MTRRAGFDTSSPKPTQGVANGEIVTCNVKNVNPDNGLGTAPLPQIVTEDVTCMTESDNVSPRPTQGLANGETVTWNGNVTGDVISMTWVDTTLPKYSQGVAVGENEFGHGSDMESRLGTAPMTLNVTGDVPKKKNHH